MNVLCYHIGSVCVRYCWFQGEYSAKRDVMLMARHRTHVWESVTRYATKTSSSRTSSGVPILIGPLVLSATRRNAFVLA
ncbi:hypothetical protein AAHA92_05242 [Salvia divinorum]|uniref:Secreted protein n=1 Tax=Salvia divinorum TaxID=28513 RepID=A0ABD1I1T1_SALDI